MSWILITFLLCLKILGLTASKRYYASHRFWGINYTNSSYSCNNYLDISIQFNSTQSSNITITIDAPDNLWFAIGFPNDTLYYNSSADLMSGYAIAYYYNTTAAVWSLREWTVGSKSCVSPNCITVHTLQNAILTSNSSISGRRVLVIERLLSTADVNDYSFDITKYELLNCYPLLTTFAVGYGSDPSVTTNHYYDDAFMYFWDETINSKNDHNITLSGDKELYFSEVPTTVSIVVVLNESSNYIYFNTTSPDGYWIGVGFPDVIEFVNSHYSSMDYDLMNAYSFLYATGYSYEVIPSISDRVLQSSNSVPVCSISPSSCISNLTSTSQLELLSAVTNGGYLYLAWRRQLNTCGYQFHMKEYASCRPLTITLAQSIDGYDFSYAISDGHYYTSFQSVTFSTKSPTNVPTPAPSNYPTLSPTNVPTYSPTINPTRSPSFYPTLHPTPSPSAPYLKYYGDVSWTGQQYLGNDYNISMNIFIWDDIDYNNVTMTIQVPSTFSVILVFSDVFTSSNSEVGAFWGNHSGDYVLEFIPWKDEVFESRLIEKTNPENTNDKYTISENYTQNIYYTIDDPYYYIKRSMNTGDPNDFIFNFTSLINAQPTYICYQLSIPSFTSFNTNANKCSLLSLVGNYALRSTYTISIYNSTIEIYLHYDPFTGNFSGYVTKPDAYWINFGYFFYETVISDPYSNTEWDFRSITVDSDESMQTYERHGTVTGDFGDVPFTTFAKNLGNGKKQVIFNCTLDPESSSSYFYYWDTVSWMSTGEMSFAYSYGNTSTFRTDLSSNAVTANKTGIFSIVYETDAPTNVPTNAPSNAPTHTPTREPTGAPTIEPTRSPSRVPTIVPTNVPTIEPTQSPSYSPTIVPTNVPTKFPTSVPTKLPTELPTSIPTQHPTNLPTGSPTEKIPYTYQTVTFSGSSDLTCDDLTVVEESRLIYAYEIALNNVSADYQNTSITIECSTILNSPSPSTIKLEFSLNIYNFSEDERWELLEDVNNNLNTFKSAFEKVLEFYDFDDWTLESMDYMTADHVAVNPYCADLPYPRICRKLLNTSSDDLFYFTLALNTTSDELIYKFYFNATTRWHGVAFATSMSTGGDAAIYTTGSTGLYPEDIYDYYIYNTSRVVLDTQNFYDITINKTDSEYVVSFYRAFDTNDNNDTVFTGQEYSINLIYAIGSSLKLEQEAYSGTAYALFTPSPNASDLLESMNSSDICGDSDNYGSSYTWKAYDITVEFLIYCETDIIEVTFKGPYDRWMGVVFNDEMQGDAIIYTTGKTEADDSSIYDYNINVVGGKDLSDVTKDSSQDWAETSSTSSGNYVTVVSQRKVIVLDSTDKGFYVGQTQLTFRMAVGYSLKLAQHEATSSTIELNLVTGTYKEIEDSKTLKIIHGSLMWIAFCILIPVGIFSSRNRFIFSDNTVWFQWHRWIQCSALILALAAFGIAIYFTQDSKNPHFDNYHEIGGLIVIFLSVQQPLNAIFRGPAPTKEEKPTQQRKIWLYFHKSLGGIAFLLAEIVIFGGLNQIDAPIIYWILHGAWIGIINFVFFYFEMYKGMQRYKKRQVERSVHTELTSGPATVTLVKDDDDTIPRTTTTPN